MSTLHLHASAAAAEEAWRVELSASAAGAVELGRDRATVTELVEAACDHAWPTATRLETIGERLLIDAVADAAEGPWRAIAATRGLRRGLLRVISDLRRAGVSAEALRDAARRAGGSAGAHGVELARRLDSYERLRAGRLDGAEVWRRGLAAIAGRSTLPMLKEVDRVVVHEVVDWDAPRLALLDALAARGLPVRVELPVAPSLARALAPSLAALESRHGQALEVAPAPLGEPRLGFTCATSPLGEARAVARRVRDLLDGGAPPESIVVCAQTPERRGRLREALERYEVPVAERHPPRATDAPPVRIALDLYLAVEEELPRERLVALLSSRYVAGGVESPDGEGWLPPHRVARALREAGATGAGAYAERLAAWVRAQPEPRQASARAIAEHVTSLVAKLTALPAAGTFAEHAHALSRVLAALELFARARGFRAGGQGGREESRAIARDQAAVRELEVTLVDLPRAAARAGLRSSRVERGRFARLLGEVLASRPLRQGGVRGASVELTDLHGVAGRRFAHLFACGLDDGEVPPRVLEDPLLPDDERAALNRALGLTALPLASRLAELGPLDLARALGGAASAHLSWTRADEDGAPRLRSPLLDALDPPDARPRAEVDEVGLEPVPRVAEARTVDELAARAALEHRGDRASRLQPADGDAAELYRLLGEREPARLRRLDQLCAVERRRERFFAGEIEPHPFAGGLRDPGLLELLRPRLPGSEELPLSASKIERYAACRFQFFLRAVIRAAPLEEADDELDSMQRGRLAHRVLEHFFRRLAAEGRLPLTGAPVESELLDAACDQVVDEWRRTSPTGHPALFAVNQRRLRRQVRALIRAETKKPIAPGCVPSRFEHPFGPFPVEARDGGERLFLSGSIDRVDLGDGRALVLDYKSGKSDSYREQVKEEALCVTSWQLPIYAAVIRAELGGEVSARFYGLKDAAVTRPVGTPSLLAIDRSERAGLRPGVRNLGDALWSLYGSMRAGDFEIRPIEKACERCHMEAACRVIRRGVEADE